MRFVFIMLVSLLAACGGFEQQQPQAPAPVPSPTPTPPGTGGGFAEVSSIMSQYCISCHAGAAFTKSEANFRASSAKSRVQNATMPPPYSTQMDAASKAKFLSF